VTSALDSRPVGMVRSRFVTEASSTASIRVPPALGSHMKLANFPLVFLRSLVVFACAWAASSAAAQRKPDVIEDKDYCFRLVPPGKDWTLLEEVAVQRLAPDAVAGAMSARGTFGFVVVEPSLSTTLREHADLVFTAMSVADKVRTEPIELTFESRKALRYQVKGMVDGAALQWDSVVVERDGFVYQLTSGSLLTKAEPVTKELPSFHRAFHFTEGKPRPRLSSVVVADRVDVGYEVRQGVFRSSAYGLAVEPKPAWRLCVGFELQKMNPSAHVGLLHTDPDIYVTVVCERADESESSEMIASIVGEPDEELQRRIPPMSVQVMGQRWDLVPLEPPTAGLECLHGAVFANGFVVQVLAWYRQADSARVRGMLAEGLSGLRWQTDVERQELAARMALAPDPQNIVAPTSCMRGGIVRDFANAYRWTRPAGAWLVSIGDAARARNESCSLYFQELASGILGLVICEDLGDFDLETYTSVVTGNMFEEGDLGDRTARKFGEHEGIVTIGRRFASIELEYHVATVLTKKHAYQMVLWGTPSNMARGEALLKAAMDGLYVSDDPERPVVTTATTVRDLRLGYELLRPGKGWKRTPIPLAGMEGVVSGVMYRNDDSAIGVVAGWFEQDGTKDGLLADLAPDMIRKQFADDSSNVARLAKMDRPPVESRDEIAGFSCRRLSWTGPDGGIDVLLFGRDRTSYMVIAVGTTKSNARETAKASLKLLP